MSDDGMKLMLDALLRNVYTACALERLREQLPEARDLTFEQPVVDSKGFSETLVARCGDYYLVGQLRFSNRQLRLARRNERRFVKLLNKRLWAAVDEMVQ